MLNKNSQIDRMNPLKIRALIDSLSQVKSSKILRGAKNRVLAGKVRVYDGVSYLSYSYAE